MNAKKIITALAFLTIAPWTDFIFAETTTHVASFDCTKATSKMEKTICGSETLAASDVELAAIYNNLISSLPNAEKNRLKKEQIAWLATRENSCGKNRISVACVQDLYTQRIDALNKVKLSTIERNTRVATQGPRSVKVFKKTDKIFTAVSKGILDINLKRALWFDVSVNLKTGILKGKWKGEREVSTSLMEVESPDHLFDVEIVIAMPFFDDQYKKVEGYYFLVYLEKRSKPGSDGGGMCGAGYEDEIAVLLTDTSGKVISKDYRLVNSCLEPIGSLFMRDSPHENIIYVIYHKSDDLKLLKIDYLYPKKAIIEISGKVPSK
jgi:uncharacterized protein